MDDVQRQFNQNDREHSIIMKKLEEFGDKLTGIEVSIAKLPQELMLLFDERYANKETETDVKRVKWLVISAFVLAVIGLVIGEKYLK